LKKEIFRRFFIVIVIALVICEIISAVALGKMMLERTEQDMIYALRLADHCVDYDSDLQSEIDQVNSVTLTQDSRITVLDLTGTVLADSSVEDSERMENHGDREEIKQALESGAGISLRYSDTIHKQMLYVARVSEVEPQYIIRLAVPFYGIQEFFPLLLPALLISLVISLLLSLFLANRFSQSITKPLNEISQELLKIKDKNRQFHFSEYDYEELNQIVLAVVKLSDEVGKSMENLEQERNKIDYILSNMTEGFLLLDQEDNVLMINKAAKRFLSCPDSVLGDHIIHYTQNMKLIHGIDSDILQDEHLTFDMPSGNRILSVHISRIQNGIFEENHTGTVILLVDVTAQRNAQTVRQEFFSNASHELKTPITSIQGYAELLNAGLFSDEAQRSEFLQRIIKEAQNMTCLINDILMISKLENGQSAQVMSPVKMRPLIEDVVNSLIPFANQNHVSLQWESEDIVYQGNLQQLGQLISNLVSNAIKYNRPDGSVKVTAQMAPDGMKLMVSDTGIGIAPEYQQRVFERFFRVDKGRSRKMGGTGLGLSIVKHIVNFYHGTVSLESEVDVGTTITIVLPVESNELR
jgi:two-component system phosphate regulon sensor histidine kinase PhoR